MTVSNVIVGNAIAWWEPNSGTVARRVEHRATRNKWLRAQGIGGVVKDGKQSKTIPDWWGDGTEFWFADEIDEQIFLDRWK
jgi:hypothetical protein